MATIDELVATHVMGWRKELYPQFSELLPSYHVWVKSETEYDYVENFNPSTNIVDAWEVVKHLKTKGLFFIISTRDFSLMVWKYGENKEVQVLKCIEDTLSFDEIPLAICRGSLAAVGVDVDG